MAVYTHLSTDDISAHLARYALGTLVSAQPITEGVENTNYCLETTKGRFILTLLEKRADATALPFYLSFMRALQDAGIPTAGVVRTHTGETTALLAGKTALISHFLDGTWARLPTPKHAAAAGALLARMHLVGAELQQDRKNAMGLQHWRHLIETCGARADRLEAGLADTLADALNLCAQTTTDTLPHGVIHADLFPDNVFFNDAGEVCGVIDFYFACRDVLAYDLMLTFNAWCFDSDGGIDQDRARAFIAAYQSVRPLSAQECSALPALGQAAALRIIATRLYDWLHPVSAAIAQSKDPRCYLSILRYHRSAAVSAAYPWWPA